MNCDVFDLPMNEDVFDLVSHLLYSLTGCLPPAAFLLFLYWVFTGLSALNSGLHWKHQNSINNGRIQAELVQQKRCFDAVFAT